MLAATLNEDKREGSQKLLQLSVWAIMEWQQRRKKGESEHGGHCEGLAVCGSGVGERKKKNQEDSEDFTEEMA